MGCCYPGRASGNWTLYLAPPSMRFSSQNAAHCEIDDGRVQEQPKSQTPQHAACHFRRVTGENGFADTSPGKPGRRRYRHFDIAITHDSRNPHMRPGNSFAGFIAFPEYAGKARFRI